MINKLKGFFFLCVCVLGGGVNIHVLSFHQINLVWFGLERFGLFFATRGLIRPEPPA